MAVGTRDVGGNANIPTLKEITRKRDMFPEIFKIIDNVFNVLMYYLFILLFNTGM